MNAASVPRLRALRRATAAQTRERGTEHDETTRAARAVAAAGFVRFVGRGLAVGFAIAGDRHDELVVHDLVDLWIVEELEVADELAAQADVLRARDDRR